SPTPGRTSRQPTTSATIRPGRIPTPLDDHRGRPNAYRPSPSVPGSAAPRAGPGSVAGGGGGGGRAGQGGHPAERLERRGEQGVELVGAGAPTPEVDERSLGGVEGGAEHVGPGVDGGVEVEAAGAVAG